MLKEVTKRLFSHSFLNIFVSESGIEIPLYKTSIQCIFAASLTRTQFVKIDNFSCFRYFD